MNKHLKPPAIDPRELDPYVAEGWQLIPLHRPGDSSRAANGKTRMDGKRPLDTDWTTKEYDSVSVRKRAIAEDRNVGVRLSDGQLVIDVDPRNGGDAGFVALCRDLGIDPRQWPRVITGSGGSHYYMTKPEDVPVVDSLPQYPGVEFKSRGRQVVSAGSAHPDTLRAYEWDFLDHPPLEEATPAPDSLIDLIRRPVGSAATEGGQYTSIEIAPMLEALDPASFRDHDRWLRLMMSVHHASGGEAREEFLDWSESDPNFADSREENGRRWDSLHADKKGAITYATLHHILTEAGRGDAIPPRSDAADDFPDDLTEADLARFGTADGDPLEAVIVRMNERFCAVLDGGGFKVFREDEDDAFGPPRRVFERLSRESFLHYHEDERIRLMDGNRDTTVAQVWLKHPRRRKYPGIVMDPDGRHGDKLNLWCGWAVDPSPGDWSLMLELIRDVLCAGNQEHAGYVIRWVAYMLQHPGRMPEVAIVFRGEEGTGKGTFGRALLRIAGTHGLTVSSPGQFAGRFNAHLRDCVFLFADEAFWPGDKEAIGVLKQLITEPMISYEAKGKDIASGRNMIHVVLASNNKWVIPAGLKSRRFAVFDVAEDRRKDRAFWDALNRQLAGGGLAGMAHDLLAMDLGAWEPKDDVPQTNALAEQRERTLDPPTRFWLKLIDDDRLPHHKDRFGATWADWDRLDEGEIVVDHAQKELIVDAYAEFLKENNIRYAQATQAELRESGRKAFGLRTDKKRRNKRAPQERVWVLPTLAEARQRFEKSLGSTGRFED